MMRRILHYFYAGALIALIASCSSSRRLGKMPVIGGLTGQAYVEKVIDLAPHWQSVSGKVAFTLDCGSKGTAKMTANLRMKREKMMLLSVAPLLGIEVARLEITPEGILVLDRLNKRYVEVSFEKASRLLQTELNFNIFQSLFLNELFLPGKSRLDVADAKSFRVTLDGENQALLEARNSRALSYRFWTSVESGLLQETRVGISGTGYGLDWKYGDFVKLDNRLFPQQMRVTVEGTGQPIMLNMSFSRLTVDSSWEGRGTGVPSGRYRKVELEELIQTLMRL